MTKNKIEIFLLTAIIAGGILYYRPWHVQSSQTSVSPVLGTTQTAQPEQGTPPSATKTEQTFDWPPSKLNEKYPDIPFIKRDGGVLKMSDLKGHYVVIHYRGTTCPACQNMAKQRASLWNDSRVVNVDVLLFNDQMKPAKAADADKWANQYGFQEANREIVVGCPDWIHAPDLYQATYNMVVGGQLLDKDGIIRASCVTPNGENRPPHYWSDIESMLNGWLAEDK